MRASVKHTRGRSHVKPTADRVHDQRLRRLEGLLKERPENVHSLAEPKVLSTVNDSENDREELGDRSSSLGDGCLHTWSP